MRARTAVLAAMAGLALLAPASASAGVVSKSGDTYTYVTTPNQVDRLLINPELTTYEFSLEAGSTGTVTPGGGCGGSPIVSCSGLANALFVVTLGEGDDGVRMPELEAVTTVRLEADGGAGADVLRGSGGLDSLTGGAGNDQLLGLGGDDTFQAADGARDIVDCGEGTVDVATVDGVDGVTGCESVLYADLDGDGVSSQLDCNDTNAAIKPGAVDVPVNGIDEDCSGADAGSPPGAPSIQSLFLSRTRFGAANTGPSLQPAAAVGTTVAYRLSEGAQTTFSVERKLRGFKRGRKCVAKKPRGKAKRCTRYKKVRGSFTHGGAAGLNSFRFMGRLRGKALRPGRYRLVAVAADLEGNRSKPRRSSFRIVR